MRTTAVLREAALFTVHVIDDDRGIQLALDSLLRSVGYATRLYGSASEFLRAEDREGPGCLILDIRLPGVSGLDFQAQLAGAGSRMPVILMTGHGDIPMSVRGMKAGAVDFLPKPFRDQDMLDAVAAAKEREAKARARAHDEDALRRRFGELSSREREVMALVAAGLMNKQVAFELGLSEITVKIHRGNAMRKMEARSLAGLVMMAQALKLEPPQPRARQPL